MWVARAARIRNVVRTQSPALISNIASCSVAQLAHGNWGHGFRLPAASRSQSPPTLSLANDHQDSNREPEFDDLPSNSSTVPAEGKREIRAFEGLADGTVRETGD